ncbi:MAG: hypothetical protein K0B37_12660 [Bacteroidales bacterium]|nr:hypothetical protein [Bacteroidales bacterium]
MLFPRNILYHIKKGSLPNLALRDKLRAILLGVAMLVIPYQVLPQACCSGGVPLGGSLGLGTADHKSLQFLATYDYNLLNDLMDVSEILPDDTRQRTTHSAILEVNYGVSPRFSIAAVLPLIRQERNIRSFGGVMDFTSAQGLGDAALLLKYRVFDPYKYPDLEWVVGAGPKFPTGRTNFTNNNGLAMAADMQPGSGSLDGLFWSFFQQRNVWLPTLSLMAVTTIRISGENRNYNQVQTYKFGNEFQFNLGVNYNTYLHWPVDIFTWFRYRNQSEDLIDGSTFPGSGGNWVYAIPGINLYFHPRMSWRISMDIPLYRKLEGTQLTTTYRFTTAISYSLPL